jgi:ABC-2 type transport system permease protein
MATTTGPISHESTRPAGRASRAAFRALLLRDLTVLRKSLAEFIPRTMLQPFMLVFVFAYVFPKIGQGVGGSGAGATAFSTQLIAGVLGLTVIFQGIQSVALPLVNEIGFTREIEDRVLAPLPVGMVGVEKITNGAINGLIAAVLVFPIAAIVPATPVHLQIKWLELITLAPLAAATAAALGLFFGTKFEPRQVPILFGIIVLPITFLGAVYYPWSALSGVKAFGVPWLQILTLANPLVYMCEGFRAALTPTPHMSLWAVYPALIGFTLLLGYLGIRGFKRRVLS